VRRVSIVTKNEQSGLVGFRGCEVILGSYETCQEQATCVAIFRLAKELGIGARETGSRRRARAGRAPRFEAHCAAVILHK
jgi:hypothetical protein